METADWNVLKSTLKRHIKIQGEIETDSVFLAETDANV